MVSNTAEVLQYPKTTPDAPESVSLSQVTNTSMLISWTAPISDGGDAIQQYVAEVTGGQTRCTVNGTVNTCVVTGLSAGSTYRVAVVAVNGAGNSPSTESVITFRSANVTPTPTPSPSNGGGSNGGANGGGSNAGETKDVWVRLDKVATAKLNGFADISQVSANSGGTIVFYGKGLSTVFSVHLADETPLKIITTADNRLVLAVPAAKTAGWRDVWFRATGTTIRYMDVFHYEFKAKPVVKVLRGFKVPPKGITKAQKAQLRKILIAAGNYKRVECKGYTKPSVVACAYLKKLRPHTVVRVKRVKVKPTSIVATVTKLTFTK